MKWLRVQNIGPTYIQAESPWQNGFVESFNGKLRDECLKRKWFITRKEEKLVVEKRRQFYNNTNGHIPRSAIAHRPRRTSSDGKVGMFEGKDQLQEWL